MSESGKGNFVKSIDSIGISGRIYQSMNFLIELGLSDGQIVKPYW